MSHPLWPLIISVIILFIRPTLCFHSTGFSHISCNTFFGIKHCHRPNQASKYHLFQSSITSEDFPNKKKRQSKKMAEFNQEVDNTDGFQEVSYRRTNNRNNNTNNNNNNNNNANYNNYNNYNNQRQSHNSNTHRNDNYRHQHQHQQHQQQHPRQSYNNRHMQFNHYNHSHQPSLEHINLHNNHTMSYLKSLEFYGEALRQRVQVVLLLIGIPGCGKSTLSKRIIRAVNGPIPTVPTTSSLSVQQESTEILHDTDGKQTEVIAVTSINDIPKMVAINQDVVKKRGIVEELMIDALLNREQSVVIDRCNFNPEQRGHWLHIANQRRHFLNQQHPQLASYQGPHVICVVLKDYANVQVCRERAFARGDSDGIHDADTNWNQVCNAMKSQLVYPDYEEHRHFGLDGGIQCIYHCQDDKEVDAFIDQLTKLQL